MSSERLGSSHPSEGGAGARFGYRCWRHDRPRTGLQYIPYECRRSQCRLEQPQAVAFRRSSPSELPRLDADWQAEEDVDWSSESADEIESAVTRSLSAIWEGGLVGTKDDIGLVGHRVVHGGNIFLEPVIIDDQVTKRLETLAEFAPLHNPIDVRLIQIARRVLSKARHAAVFDTAFHKTLPPEAFRYPVPNEWFEKFHIRKYGFHGINHKYCSHRAAELLHVNRIITCHLGGGCSLAAVMDGVSVETTMGFTPLDGLMMRSRSGSIDPSILFS